MLVQDGVYDAFVKKLTERVAALVVGNGATDGVHLGPLINGGGLDKVERLVADAVSKVRPGGSPCRHRPGCPLPRPQCPCSFCV